MDIKQYEIAEDVLTVCVKATSFPLGIKDAYDKLNKAVGEDKPRQLYGVTEIVNEELIYRACVTKLDGDDELGLDEYTIPGGVYLYTLLDWEGNEDQFGPIFKQLMAHPDAKPGTIGLEKYYVTDKDAMLMVQKK